MWGRLHPRVWLGLYIAALACLLLGMYAVRGPVKFFMRRAVEREYGGFLEPSWSFPYTGYIGDIEPASGGGLVILYNELYGDLAVESYAPDGQMQQRLVIENPGLQFGVMRSLPDGYLVNSPGVVTKVTPSLTFDWKLSRDNLDPLPVLPDKPCEAVGVVACPDGLFGVDDKGQPAWRAGLLNPLEADPQAGWRLSDRLRFGPTGEFILTDSNWRNETLQCIAYSSTGQEIYHTEIPKVYSPAWHPLRGGGMVVVCSAYESYRPQELENIWISPDGQYQQGYGYGCLRSFSYDPAGKTYLVGREYVGTYENEITWLSGCDTAGTVVNQFALPGYVYALDFGSQGNLVVFWQTMVARNRGLVLLGCYDPNGVKQWQRIIGRYEDSYFNAHLAFMRVVNDQVLLAFNYYNVASDKLLSYPLPQP